MSKEIKELYEFGPFQMDAARRLVHRGEQVLPLTSKAFDTLLTLVRNRDRVLVKDELMKTLWPDSFVEEVNLAQSVSTLRKILGESPGENLYIATIPGKGYRFVGEVRAIGGAGDELVVERHTRARMVIREGEEAGEDRIARDLGAPTRGLAAGQAQAWHRKWGLALLFAVALIGAGLVVSRTRNAGSIAEQSPHSLAVLPFQWLAAGPDDQHLGLGVADAVITKLSNIRQLAVRPTDVVMRYTDPKVDPMHAAREMGVDSVLSGKIQKSDDQIRLTVQLVRVRDGRPLWAETFDENFTNIFAVEDSISEKVVQALAVNLAVQEKQQLDRHYTENIDAYRNYLKGRYAEFTFTRQGMNQAIEYFGHATADDPGYALAYAGLADAYTTESDWLLAPREAMPKAEAAARKALAFDNNLAEAHEALAHALLHEWRLPEANQEFHRALVLNPNSVSTYYTYAEYLSSIGQEDQAIAEMHRALTIDPLSPEVNSFLAWDLYLKRDYQGCLTTSHKTMQMFPEFWVPHLIAGMCYFIQGQFVEATAQYQKARMMNPDSTFALAGVGMSSARSGKKGEARKALAEMEGLSKRSYVSPFYIGLIDQALGERDLAFEWYAKGYDDQEEFLLWLTIDPLFDEVRSDPRFADLVRRVGIATPAR